MIPSVAVIHCSTSTYFDSLDTLKVKNLKVKAINVDYITGNSLISKPPTMVKTAIIVIVLVKELGKSVLFWIILWKPGNV